MANIDQKIDEIRDFQAARVDFAKKLGELCLSANQDARKLSQITKISAEFVDALLDGEFDRLPGKIFGRGFVKSICEVLGVDPKPYMLLYVQCWPDQQDSTIKSIISDTNTATKFAKSISGPERKFKLNKGSALALFAAITVASLLSIFLYIYNSKHSVSVGPTEVKDELVHSIEKQNFDSINHDLAKDDKQAEGLVKNDIVQAQKEQKIVSVAVSGNKSEEKASSGELLHMLVKEKVRIRKKIGDEPSEIKEYEPGDYTFEIGSSAEFLIYDAALVEIDFNGRKLGRLGNKGRVRKLVFLNSNQQKF
ncbi:MAG: helix-turn-helix domain-containing protein [Bdellovibrionota bacterium]